LTPRFLMKILRKLIIILSISVPLAVAVLFALPKVNATLPFDVHILPLCNAIINTMVAICLCFGFYFIKSNNIILHKRMMTNAFILSCFFLFLYIFYHLFSQETKFGDINHDGIADASEKAALGAIRYFYYFVLLTHILLSIGIIPLVLFTMYYSYTNQIFNHKRLAKFTFPLWLYVAVTGIIAYIMISPYY